MTAQKTFINSFSYIRIFACLAIVFLHSLFAGGIYYADTLTDSQEIVSKVLENLQMWAVPCFLMVTGALLLNPDKELTIPKLKGYIMKIVWALLFFTFLFQIFEYFFEGDSGIFLNWIQKLFSGESWAHMWYLYLMLGLYLMMPFYKLIVNHASDRMILILVTIIVVFVSILPISECFGISTGFYIPTSIVYPVYLFLGWYLYKNPPSIKWGLALFIIPTILIILLSIWLPEEFNDLFAYKSILVIMQTCGVFVVLNKVPFKEREWIKTLDKCTFGIYLIHMIFIRMVLKWIGYDPYNSVWVLNYLVMAVLFFAVSYGITYGIRYVSKGKLL